jgi:class 3 adenylate cyclase
MPLYMDIHSCDGAHVEDVAKAHIADMEVQDKYGVDYKKYWFNESCGKLFCLVEAPSAEAAQRVHLEAHGLVAEKFIEIDPELVDSYMGPSPTSSVGAALLPGATADTQRDTGVRTIMFTDIVDSTALTSQFGDDAAMAMLAVHDRIVRDALRGNGGREVKHTGDGIMAAFISPAGAVRGACAVQNGLRDHNSTGPEYPVTVRIGISAGEPVEKSDDLFGSTVQLAARLCARAEPGQILVSSVIADLCIGKGLKFIEGGEFQLKGFAEPIETHVVEMVC